MFQSPVNCPGPQSAYPYYTYSTPYGPYRYPWYYRHALRQQPGPAVPRIGGHPILPHGSSYPGLP